MSFDLLITTSNLWLKVNPGNNEIWNKIMMTWVMAWHQAGYSHQWWPNLCGHLCATTYVYDSKVHGANMGPIWDRKDPGGPHIDPMNFAVWGVKQI